MSPPQGFVGRDRWRDRKRWPATKRCLWPGCERPVSGNTAFFGCKPHWWALPVEIRTEIWRAGERGTDAYSAATAKAREWIAGIPARIKAMGVTGTATGGSNADSDS